MHVRFYRLICCWYVYLSEQGTQVHKIVIVVSWARLLLRDVPDLTIPKMLRHYSCHLLLFPILQVLGGFNHLWTEGALCDVILIAENRRFDAHRIVLASCSHYFRTMFTRYWLPQDRTRLV